MLPSVTILAPHRSLWPRNLIAGRSAGMAQGEPQPWFFNRVGLDALGGTVKLERKASSWELDDDTTFLAWEFRRVLDSLGYSSANLVKDFMRNTLPKVVELLRKLGMEDFGEDIIPSRKSLRTRGMPENEWPAYVRDEWGISTGGLLFVLLCTLQLRRGPGRVRSEAVLLRFLEAALPADCRDRPEMLECVESLAMTPAGCGGDAQVEGVCEHVMFAHGVVHAHRDECGQTALAQLLVEVFDGPCWCPSLGDWLTDLVSVVGNIILKGLDTTCSTDPLNAQEMRGKKRRRRLDEDMKRQVCEHLQRSGRARNGRVWARATAHCSAKSMDRIRDSYLTTYLTAIHEQFHDSDAFRVVLDGARVGEPAKEYIVGVLEECSTGSGAWVPPQVSWDALGCKFGYDVSRRVGVGAKLQ